MNTLCILPWLTLDTLPDGALGPCCYMEVTQRFDGKAKSIKQYQNSSNLVEIKEAMLNGDEPSACSYCYKREKCGSESPRQKNNENFLTPERKAKILSREETNFEHLHLRLSNTCDMSCRSCSAFCSTSWNKDRLSINPSFKPLTLDLFENSPELENEVIQLCSTVEHLYISGGEPVMDPRLPEVLMSFISGKNFKTRSVSIQTNLTNGHILKEVHTNLLKEIPSLIISVSIDGIGKQGEFIRQGLNWDQFKINLTSLKKTLPNATVIFTPTISIYNVFHILELFDYLTSEGLLKKSWIELYMVNSPMALNPTILPAKLKKQVFEAYNNYQNQEPKILEALDEIKAYLSSKDNEAEFINFISFTKTLDRLRNQDTFKLFPELKLSS